MLLHCLDPAWYKSCTLLHYCIVRQSDAQLFQMEYVCVCVGGGVRERGSEREGEWAVVRVIPYIFWFPLAVRMIYTRFQSTDCS
jgi:hypothetical protein